MIKVMSTFFFISLLTLVQVPESPADLFDRAGFRSEKVLPWLEEVFTRFEPYLSSAIDALKMFRRDRLHFLPDLSSITERALLMEHFWFNEDLADRFLNPKVNFRSHISLLNEIRRYLRLVMYPNSQPCPSSPGTWINVRSAIDNCHEQINDGASIFRVSDNNPDEITNAVADLAVTEQHSNSSILFHGTSWTHAWRILRCPYLDQGVESDFLPLGRNGFYLSNDWTMARQWAERTAQLRGEEAAVIAFQVSGTVSDLITRHDNLSLEGDEDMWRDLVTTCRNDPENHDEWCRLTANKSSISGPVGAMRASGRWEPIQGSWQLCTVGVGYLPKQQVKNFERPLTGGSL